ncbi:HAD-like domain-containing protein [Lentinula lateritia]|uniref:HAD-like domain-containing protein n=1 Tax=Lentinula aff. lateritia TaxID=2804960 RepID=A0ACC1TT36_9AGAR|nr:HAD-like domain-containing protein [Lentinula aff. lateritia]KAJ3851536.1 HAD-like domain-containing protein [Lentinula lateritia]
MAEAHKFKAVVFDIGGVVVRSPFLAIARYEREHRIPENYLNCSIVARGSEGAWQKFERGELELFPFYNAFSQNLSDTVNGNRWYRDFCKRKGIQCPELPDALHVDGRELFGMMMRESTQYDPHILEAIRRIRAVDKHKIIALTNNFSRNDTAIPSSELDFLGWQDGATPNKLKALFDDFCDSSTLGTRKPEPRFYLLACERNGIKPSEAVFLDDIGLNLKAARDLGMETIHVPIGGTLTAVKVLGQKLGLDLTAGPAKL